MKISISAPQNIWSDAQSVDDGNLTLEQNYNDQIHSSLIGNHLGNGVIPESLSQHILFDSNISSGLLDGKLIDPQSQPSDYNNGNQLEISLTGSRVAGSKTIKIILIGLDFQDNLQYDTFTFSKNESQFTVKHYRNLLGIFINDFVGTELKSFNLGGRLVIKETSPMSVSRDPVMISQDVEPNLIFRDFYIASGGTLSNLLSGALPNYNIDTLNIKTGYKQLRGLIENDVSSQIGQKFLSTTNNIQKITLLMSTVNNSTPSNLVWSGNLIVSLYALQSTVQCSTDIVPNLAIDFDPTNIPLAQVSLTYASMLDNGIRLNEVPQPIDFVFSNTPVGSGLLIKPNNYYVITIKRAGSAAICELQVAIGSNTYEDTRETIFNGSVWVDIPEEALWFKVYSNAVKVSDGQAYDNGKGIQITKTIVDENTGLTIDNCLRNKTFLVNNPYNAVMQASLKEMVPVQNERTGNPINSQKEYIPSLSLLTNNELSSIKSVSDPIVLATVSDKNIKSTTNDTIVAAMHHYCMVGNEIIIKIIDDSLDTLRYDTNLIAMVSDLVSGKLNNSKLIPNLSDPTIFYRIVKSELLTLMYGDVNGDGIIDNNDIFETQELLGTDLNIFPTEANYLANITDFISDSPVNWQLINKIGPSVIASGSDGIITANGTIANFNSASYNFTIPFGTSIHNIAIKITSSIIPTNIGSFPVTTFGATINDIGIKKIIYNSDFILKTLRADISGDMIITDYDTTLISEYVDLTDASFPPSSPSNKIGTTFQAIKLTVDKYVDRIDDYPGTDSNRATTLHTSQDMYLDGYSFFASKNVLTSPIGFNIIEQLNWNENNILINLNQKMVPASFNFNNGYNVFSNTTNLNLYQEYPIAPSFDPGRNDIVIPNNLIMNPSSQLTTLSGDYYKVDFEMNTISFEIPDTDIFLGSEKTVNLLTDFISDYTGTGYTRLGYKAMRFADNSQVSINGFSNNQVRISVGVLSFSPQISGAEDGYSGVIVDPRIGISMDYTTGILSLQFSNLYKDPIMQTRSTKIQITAYLKKAGWNNTPIVIDETKTLNLLG